MQKLCFWLIRRVVRGKAVDALRRLARQSAQSLDALAAEPMDHKAAKRAKGEEENECLNAMLTRLQREDSGQCWLVRERYLQGRSVQELADEISLTANEIACRLYRAMEKMRRWASAPGRRGEDAP